VRSVAPLGTGGSMTTSLDSRIDVQTDLAWVLLVVHVPCAATAMILGALQLVPRIRARRRG
jgi:hypothetical protein